MSSSTRTSRVTVWLTLREGDGDDEGRGVAARSRPATARHWPASPLGAGW